MRKADVLGILVALAFTSAGSMAQAEQETSSASSNDEAAVLEGGLNSAIAYPRQPFNEAKSIEGGMNSPVGSPENEHAVFTQNEGGLLKAGFNPLQSQDAGDFDRWDATSFDFGDE